MELAMLGNIFTDLNNWIRGWSQVTFAIVLCLLIIIGLMFSVNILKGLLGGKTKFKVFSFIFLALIIGIIIYICIKH